MPADGLGAQHLLVHPFAWYCQLELPGTIFYAIPAGEGGKPESYLQTADGMDAVRLPDEREAGGELVSLGGVHDLMGRLGGAWRDWRRYGCPVESDYSFNVSSDGAQTVSLKGKKQPWALSVLPASIFGACDVLVGPGRAPGGVLRLPVLRRPAPLGGRHAPLGWAGDSVILLSYVKGRTAAESLNLPRRAVRLLEQWLSHSALLRSHASPECRGDLWLRLNKPGGTRIWDRGGAAGRVAVQRWIERHGVTSDDGGPLKVHRSRIRTTRQSMRDKRAWAGRGRATIDPNHSPEVEGDHYLTATTPSQRQAAEAIVEDAQHDLLRRALPPTVVSAEDAASLARSYPELVASPGLDGTVVAELAGGERDVFTAACADQLSGLHGPAGRPCPARPWVCLLCPLAVFAPRHAPNLLRLKAFFSRQWQQMPAAQFMAPGWAVFDKARIAGSVRPSKHGANMGTKRTHKK